ncbi:hypothetical protein BBJ28_00021134, partial [Nothophytophthora sp. Chile5]
MTALRAKQAETDEAFGINGVTGKVTSSEELGVWEPFQVKTQSIKTAVEAACMLLRIDDIRGVDSSRREGEDILMALDRELRRLLEYATMPEQDAATTKDVPRTPARAIFERLVGIYGQTCVPSMAGSVDMNLPELLVLTAEAAIFQTDFATASQSVEWFFSECQLKNQVKNSYKHVLELLERLILTRKRYVLPSFTAAPSSFLKKVLNAIHFILSVLPIATDAKKRPTYDFLVYNASVTYWQISRQLMKPSTFQFLVSSLLKIIEALKLIGEADVAWLIRLQLALVYAQMDENLLANAAKTINDLVDVQITPRLTDPARASDESFKALYEEALLVQVHIGSMKDPECQKIVPNVKRMIPSSNKRSSLLVKLQCVKSGNVPGSLEAAYVEIFQEAMGFLAFSLETPENDVKTFVSSLESRALDAIDAEVIVETAIHAAFNKVFRIADACDLVLQSKGKNMSPRIRVLHQVLTAILLVTKPLVLNGGKQGSRQRQSALLSRRVEGVKAFERALLASKRQQNANLVERVCIYAWNLSLPLLQPHLRAQLERVFSLSAAVLEELDSLLLGFRARLYLEVAKLEMVSDFLAKANANVSKALALDYGTIVRSSEAPPMTVALLSANESWVVRPVDTHLMPIKRKLNLKLAAENALSKSDQVLAMLEQIKEGKDVKQQASTLTRCVEMMIEMECSVDSPAAAEHVRLWSEMATLAWNVLHDGEMAQQIAENALTIYFSPSEAGELVTSKGISSEKSLMALEVDLRLLLVEAIAEKLKRQAMQVVSASRQVEAVESRQAGRKPLRQKTKEDVDLAALVLLGKEVYNLGVHRPRLEESPVSVETSVDGDEEDENAVIENRTKALEQEIHGMKMEILKHLAVALKAATRIGWPFILENTCIYLWNHHFHIFRMILESSKKATDSATESFDPQWILPECLRAFEAVYEALEAASSGVHSDLLANIALGLSSIYEKTARLDKALAIADTFLKRKPLKTGVLTAEGGNEGNTLQLKRFVELKARVQIAQNAKEIVPTESSSVPLKVVAFLEAMELTFWLLALPSAQSTQLMDKAQSLYQKAVTMWQASAGDILAGFSNRGLDQTLEEEQQQLELYVEVWVRVGCGAFRLQNVKYAIECAEQALLVQKTKQVTQLLIVGSTWKWFSLAELLYGRAILALGHRESPAPKLVLASLTHLVRAIEYGLRGNSLSLAINACEIVWNATVSAINSDSEVEAEADEEAGDFLDQMVEHLRKVLRYLDQIASSPEAGSTFYGEMTLLTLAVCGKAERWSEAFEVCENVLKSFGPASHRPPLPGAIMKDIQTTYAIAGANLGKPSSAPKGGATAKSQDQLEEGLLQAQILKKVAFASWKDPPAQLKALSNAYTELEGQPEEQALVMIDIAEWLFTNQFPSQSAEHYLECAAFTLLNRQRRVGAASQSPISRMASSSQLLGSSAGSKYKPDVVYSPLWVAEKLLRVFVMRATLAKTCRERAEYQRLALHQVEQAWEGIFLMMNELEWQSAFDRERADAANESNARDFDDWKKDKPAKYAVPNSERDWIRFFLEHEETVNKRFYMPWVKTLQSVETVNVRHITQPVLTGAYLEMLLTTLRTDGLQYGSMIPTLGLHLVIFHAYIPQRTHTASIWLELTQFEILERLNLPNSALPLQSALDMIQNHGDVLVKEIQDADNHQKQSESTISTRKRDVLQVSRLDTGVKTIASIHLLLQFGFVRQAKVLLELLKHSLDHTSTTTGDSNNAPATELAAQCDVLSSRILEMEGQTDWALVRMKSALQCPQVSIQQFLEWTLRRCKLDTDLAKTLRILQVAEKEAAKTVVTGMRRVPGNPGKAVSFDLPPVRGGVTVTSSPPDLDVVLLIARVIFKRAKILLKRAADAKDSDILRHLQESKQALQESLNMLSLVGASYECSQLLLRYSRAVLAFEKRQGSLHMASAGSDSREMLQEALVLLETCQSRLFRFPSASGSEPERLQREAVVSPLDLNIALTKLEVATLLIDAEMSAPVIQEEDMTWYRYYQDSQRNVVEKWLSTTEALQQSREWELPHAMTLITSAIGMLSSNTGVEEHLALAQVLGLQCQRLSLFHGDDKAKAAAIRSRLWTRFTSSDAPHATWICCQATRPDSSDSLASKGDQQVMDAQQEQDLLDQQQVDAFLATSIPVLLNCQRIAFAKRFMDLIRRSSYELVQVLGCQRPYECAKHLLKYQSATVHESAADLFARCVSHTNVQHLHLRRMQKLRKMHTNAAANSLPFQLSQLYLDQQSDAFKRMSVVVTVDAILASLPTSVRVLCLQFSPERCFLYAALVGKSDKHGAMARMEFTDAQTTRLGQLQQRNRVWRAACAKKLLLNEEARGQDESFEFTPVESFSEASAALPATETTGDSLEKEFTAIVTDTIELLNPLFAHSTMQAELNSSLAGNTLVLLVDRTLADLPLEALPALQSADAITRDFSIHMLHQRLVAVKTQPLCPSEMRVIVDPRREDPGDARGQTMATVVKQTSSPWKEAVEHGQIPSVTDWQHAL